MIITEKRGKWFVEDNNGNRHKFQSMAAAETFVGTPVVKEVIIEVEEAIEVEDEAFAMSKEWEEAE